MKVSLPEELKPYQFEAESELARGVVKDIEFSGATYQVLVEDRFSYQNSWVFLQLEGEGKIRDAFCAGDHEAESSTCLHLAIAYLSLFKEFAQPLHQRFARSLWNHLCHLYEERLGSDPQILIEEAVGTYLYYTQSGKKIFELRALTSEATQFLDKTLHQRTLETEETSLKFSNLTREELSLWHEGRPNPRLRYDLSFWSDLAKWFMKKTRRWGRISNLI